MPTTGTPLIDARRLWLIHVVWAWAPSDPIAKRWWTDRGLWERLPRDAGS